jgi:ABC-type nitrate/sulfonate/bicarbonate transport system substrate-binding protein
MLFPAALGGLLLALTTLVAACGSGSDSPAGASGTPPALKRVTFMAGFKAQANLPFVGAYVAQEKGFFQDQGLQVQIRHAQSGEHLQLLLTNEVQFSTANGAQVIQRNAEGLPLVSIALVGQKSEQGFAVGAGSGINSVADWAGKRFGYKGTVPVEFHAIAKANGLNPSRVNQVRVGFDPRILSEGQVDILAVFVSNEPGQLERIGYPVRVFDPNDFGITALGLTYVTNQDLLAKDPDLVTRFTKAALRGIEYADANRQEALEIVMKYAPQENRDQQKYMLETELGRAKSSRGFGWQSREQWQDMSSTLLEFGVLDKEPNLSRVFSEQIPANILRDGKVVWP